MKLQSIREKIAMGYKVTAYGNRDGHISEIDFTLSLKGGAIAGFSFMEGDGLRQRELKALFNRVKKVVPKLRLLT